MTRLRTLLLLVLLANVLVCAAVAWIHISTTRRIASSNLDFSEVTFTTPTLLQPAMMSGRVTNSGTRPVSDVEITVEWMNAQGAVARSDRVVVIGPTPLGPGESRRFRAPTSGHVGRAVVRWRVTGMSGRWDGW